MKFNGFVTPLLVPSFSSKGNLFIHNTDGTYKSDNYDLLKELDFRVPKTYLISAYDMYYGFMPRNLSDLPRVDYLFVDSGGYETSDGYDLSERNRFNYEVRPWDKDKMISVYSEIVSSDVFDNSIVFLTSFDSYDSVMAQADSALSLQNIFSDAIIDFLIKRPIGKSFEDLLAEIESAMDTINKISVIGITEKDLGESVSDRLKNMLDLSRLLRGQGWSGNIHIFGGLEPTISQLYYLSGADIFDGLSWQRFRYSNNSTIYDPSNFIISLTEYENRLMMIRENLSVLNDIGLDLAIMSDDRIELSMALSEHLKNNELTTRKLLSIVKGENP